MTLDYERDIWANKVFRAQIKAVLNDDGDKLQQVRASGYAGEEMETLRAQTGGHTSYPWTGSLGYGIGLHGRKDLAIILGCEHPDKRPTGLREGESATYYDQNNKYHAQDAGLRAQSTDKAISHVVADNAQHRVQNGGYNIFIVKNAGNFRVYDTDAGTWLTPVFTSSTKPPDDPTRA